MYCTTLSVDGTTEVNHGARGHQNKPKPKDEGRGDRRDNPQTKDVGVRAVCDKAFRTGGLCCFVAEILAPMVAVNRQPLTVYVTPAFSGVPNRSGNLTLAFSGAQKRAEVLLNPCVLGGPQTRGKNQKSKPTLGATLMPLVSQSMSL